LIHLACVSCWHWSTPISLSRTPPDLSGQFI
jgi:hypothetical protein